MTNKTFMDCSGKRRHGLMAAAAVLTALSFQTGLALGQSAGKSGPPGLSQNFSANANKPVDIEAASLVVDDKKKIATFSGSVVVVQGDVKLRSDEIVIHYVSADKQNGGKGKPAATPVSLTGGTGGSTDISTIDAVGAVEVTTVNDQNVRGDRATFDVKAQTVVVWGKTVSVSQGGSVLHGQKLTVNLADGTYRMDASPDSSGDQRPGQSRGQIRMKIIPSEVQEKIEAAKGQAEGGKAKPEAKPEAKPKKKPAEAAPQPAPAQAGGWIVDGSGQ